MATKGKLISEYIRKEIKTVADELKSKMVNGQKIEVSDIQPFPQKFINAIAKGIYNYVSKEYKFDVKTNGTVAVVSTPPVTVPIANYAVDGELTVLPSTTLALALQPAFAPSGPALTSMTAFFSAVFGWLPVAGIINKSIDPTNQLSTITGTGTIITNPAILAPIEAQLCVNELAEVEYVDSDGNPKYDDFTIPTWDIIGDHIYNKLSVVTGTFVCAGTANPAVIPNGTVYTAITTLGTVNFN